MLPFDFDLYFERIKEGFLDLVFPRQDLRNEEPLEFQHGAGRYLSPQSRQYLYVIRPPCCGVCGFPLYGKTEGSTGCQKCQHLKPVFESNRSVLLLNRLGRRMVHDLKYHQGFHLLPDMEGIVREAEGLRDRVEGRILVPIPLHPRKLRERGFNQSEELARVFKKTLGDSSTCILPLLIRKTDTASQTMMDRKTRIANVQHAFALNPKLSLPSSQPITLVDDVFTTGSTINACAKLLKQRGFNSVCSLTFGHG